MAKARRLSHNSVMVYAEYPQVSHSLGRNRGIGRVLVDEAGAASAGGDPRFWVVAAAPGRRFSTAFGLCVQLLQCLRFQRFRAGSGSELPSGRPGLRREGGTMRRVSKRYQRGFTMLEALIVLAILSVIATMGYASLIPVLKRQKLIGAAREGANAMRQARAEAVKRGLPAGVAQDFAGRRLVVFRDVDNDGAYTAADPIIAHYPLTAGVLMLGPGDTTASPVNASWGFGEISGSSSPGTVVFNSVGATAATGAFRYSDAEGNYLEARVDPAASGKVSLRKYTPGGSDVNDIANWKEQGAGGVKWQWAG
jgi:prepilin-type N-terminal cleavage/methylation domain-containing protein